MMRKRLLVAAVVLVIAATPTFFDAWQFWQEHPDRRHWIAVTYIIAAMVAFSAWEMF